MSVCLFGVHVSVQSACHTILIPVCHELLTSPLSLVTNHSFKICKLNSETAGTNKRPLAGSHFCDSELNEISMIHTLYCTITTTARSLHSHCFSERTPSDLG